MIVTEQEAKTKWCPHARLRSLNGDVAINRATDGSSATRSKCLASECMAWKWVYGNSPAEQAERKPHGMAVKEPKGYCGL